MASIVRLLAVLAVLTTVRAANDTIYLLPPAWIPTAQDQYIAAKQAANALSISVLNTWTQLATAANRTDLARHCPFTNGRLNTVQPVVSICPFEAACPANKCRPTEVCVVDVCGALTGMAPCNATCTPIKLPPFTVPTPAAVSKVLQAKIDRVMASIPKMPKAPCSRADQVDWSKSYFGEDVGVRWACKPCPAGQISDGWFRCTPCGPGTFANKTAGACQKCAAGTAAASGATACKACAAGSFAPVGGLPACIPCPLGFQALSIGATSCTFAPLSKA